MVFRRSQAGWLYNKPMVLKKMSQVPLTTYQAGLLQSRAFRKLSVFLNNALKEHHLTMTEWAFLGLVSDHKKVRMQSMAAFLDVEPPFATKLSRSLENKGLIIRKTDTHDSRVRWITLTPAGVKLVKLVEATLRRQLRDYLKPISLRELIVYVHVLAKISNL